MILISEYMADVYYRSITIPSERELLVRYLENPDGSIRLWRELGSTDRHELINGLNAIGNSEWTKQRVQMWRNARAARSNKRMSQGPAKVDDDSASDATPKYTVKRQRTRRFSTADSDIASSPFAALRVKEEHITTGVEDKDSDESGRADKDSKLDEEVCGVLNRHGRPCKRVGRCPFHSATPSARSVRKHASDSADEVCIVILAYVSVYYYMLTCTRMRVKMMII